MAVPDVVVVGAGAFGAWTAHHLHAAGCHVTLIDAYGPANPRSSSGDETRIVRCGYGPDAIYSEMAFRSLELWQELDRGRPVGDPPLFHPSGVIWLSGDDDYTRATRRTLERGQYPVEALSGDDLRSRFPQVVAPDVEPILFEPRCGVVLARRAVRTLVANMQRAGMPVVRASVSVPVRGPVRHVELADGSRIAGDRFVFACGAWLPMVFPKVIGGRIRPTRQVVMYFGPPAGDERFGAARLPAWVDFPAGIYGTPDVDDRGVKVGIDAHGPPFNPDADDRRVDEDSVIRARAWLGRRMPLLARAPLIDSRVCQYENTSSGDFLIDRHPEHENVWIAGGGSGHGFKHGPAIGEYVTRLVTTGAPTESRFSLATKDTGARRAIY